MNALRRRSIIIALVAAAACPLAASANTYTYNYTNNSGWDGPDAWSPYGVPGYADTAIFPSVYSGGYQPYFVSLGIISNVGTFEIDTHGVFSLTGNSNYPLVINHLRDYVGQSGTPASHVISVASLQLNGNVEVGGNANLTITSTISGPIDKLGVGTLSLTGKSSIGDLRLEAGTLSLWNDPVPFTSWDKPLFVSADATVNLATSGAMTRPIRGVDAAGGLVNLTAGAGISGDVTNGLWSFIPVNVSGGGTIHTASIEFTASQANATRIQYLNVAAATTLSVDRLAGNPAVFLNGSTIRIGSDTSSTRSTEVLTPNTISTIDTSSFTYDTAKLVTSLPGVTLNKVGSGTLIVDGGNMSGFATINVNSGTMRSSLGGTSALNLGNAATFEAVRSETASTAVHILGTCFLNAAAGTTVVLNGAGLTGTGQLDAWGAGTLRLQTAITGFNGTADVDKGGRLELQTAGSPNLHYVLIEHGSSAAVLAPNQIDPMGTFAVFGSLDVDTADLGTAPYSAASTFAVFDGGTLRFKQWLNTAPTRNIYVDAGAETIDVLPGVLATVPGIVRGGGGTLTKTGGGFLMLQGANTLAGKINVSGGYLVLDRPIDANGSTLPIGTGVDVLPGGGVLLGWSGGDNNVVGSGLHPEKITPFRLLGGTLSTAPGTTHNLGAITISNGRLWGDEHPAAGFADYTLNSTVTFDPSAGDGTIDAPGGVALRGAVAFDTGHSTANPAASLDVSAVISDEPGAVGTLIKRGDGRLDLSAANTYSGGTTIEAGLVEVEATGQLGPGPLVVTSPGQVVFATGGTHVQHLRALSIEAGGGVDVADRKLVIDAGSTSLQSIRAAMVAGTLISSAATSGKVLAYADASGTHLTSFGDVTPAAGQILIGLTYGGDATFDGSVNFSDLLALAKNYGSTTGVWTSGDFTYDGSVNFNDLLILAKNYGLGPAVVPADNAPLPAAFATDWALAQSLAPEPTSGLALLVAAAMRRRRR